MSAWHRQGRARISASSPRALASCQRCGFIYNLIDLRFQMEWQGTQLQNLQYLVCDDCYDIPQQQLRTILIPPDPVPVMNPRPEPYSSEVPTYLSTEDSLDHLVTEGANPQPLVTEGIQPDG